MKKISAYLLVFIILIIPAIASALYEAEDFSKYPEQMITLKERDAVKINWDGKDNKIMLRKVYPDQDKIDLTTFVENEEVPSYMTLKKGFSLQADMDQDGEYDIKVSIFNMLKDEKTVALKIERISNSINLISTEGIIDNIDKESNQNIFKNSYFIFGIALLLLLIWKRRSVLKTYRKIKKHK